LGLLWVTAMVDPKKTPEEAIATLRTDLAKGFSAVKVMLDERFGRVERLERELATARDSITELKTKVAVLEERITNHRENTGQFRTDVLKDRIDDLKDDKKVVVEKWKATAPIVVALVAGIFALVTSVTNMVLHFIGMD